jgi:hypothetical protein
VLDALADPLEARFDFICAVAVLHMLVPDEDRHALLTFIREHLTENGFGLVVTMGDGEMQRATDIAKAFDVQPRVHEPSGRTVEIASTSCRIVTREDFRREIEAAGLTKPEPELTPSFHGAACLANGRHPGVECQCDECDFCLECFPDRSEELSSQG